MTLSAPEQRVTSAVSGTRATGEANAVAAVLWEFTRWPGWPRRDAGEMLAHWIETDLMAREIVRLRSQLALFEDSVEDAR